VAPLTLLIKKDQPFLWGVEAESAFQSLKFFFTIAPLLIDVDPMKHFVLEIDVSHFELNVILS
jgi:hypothetical protein